MIGGGIGRRLARGTGALVVVTAPLSDPPLPAADRSLETFQPTSAADGIGPLRLPHDAQAVPYYLFIPERVDPATRPLVTVHGISRRADEHMAAFLRACESSGRVLIAPLFSKDQCRRYQKVVVDRCRADRALLATLHEVGAETGIDVRRVDLFGFSGGAQFAHRFALLHPRRIGRLAVASAGWYTLPDPEIVYPYGLAPSPEVPEHFRQNLEAFLEIPILVLVGARDTERDGSLRKERHVDRRQGLTRVERAAQWSRAVRRVAPRAGKGTEVRFQILPDCGHSFEACVHIGGLIPAVLDWFRRP